MSGWIAVDLDGTLAEYHGWPADGSIGAPVPAMVERVKGWLAEGKDVRIFTARVWPLGTADIINIAAAGRLVEAQKQTEQILLWCEKHLGRMLPLTCVKDFGMIELWDDRAVQVRPNTGQPITAIPAEAKPLVPQLSLAWERYVHLFGEPPHGTHKQLSALVALMGQLPDARELIGQPERSA